MMNLESEIALLMAISIIVRLVQKKPGIRVKQGILSRLKMQSTSMWMHITEVRRRCK